MRIELNSVCKKFSVQWALCKSSVHFFCKQLCMVLYVLDCIIIVSLFLDSDVCLTLRPKSLPDHATENSKATNCVTQFKGVREPLLAACLHVSFVFLRSCHHGSTPELPAFEVFSRWQHWGGICPRQFQTSSFPSLTPSLGNSCPHKGRGADSPTPTPLNPDISLQFLLFQLRQNLELREWKCSV